MKPAIYGQRSTLFRKQQGLSALSILFILLVIGFVATCTIKMGPVYVESFAVKRAVEAAVEQAKAKNWGKGEVLGSLGRQFQVNRVEGLKHTDVKIIRKDGKTTVDATYEKRVPLMYNIDVVIKFDDIIYQY